jgi:hypothetical protein
VCFEHKKKSSLLSSVTGEVTEGKSLTSASISVALSCLCICVGVLVYFERKQPLKCLRKVSDKTYKSAMK